MSDYGFTIDAKAEVSSEERPFVANGGMGAEVTGIRVIRNGKTIQEWHADDELTWNNEGGSPQLGNQES